MLACFVGRWLRHCPLHLTDAVALCLGFLLAGKCARVRWPRHLLCLSRQGHTPIRLGEAWNVMLRCLSESLENKFEVL